MGRLEKYKWFAVVLVIVWILGTGYGCTGSTQNPSTNIPNCQFSKENCTKELLSIMMDRLESKSEDESYADFYWRWAEEVTDTIGWLYREYGFFYVPGRTVYDVAMDSIAAYVSPLSAGTQSEINYYRYVHGVIENYKMLYQNQQWANAFDNPEIRREYTLYNEYMCLVEEWERRMSEISGSYSSAAMERSELAQLRFRYRTATLKEIKGAMDNDKAIKRQGRHLEKEDIEWHFRKMKRDNANWLPVGYNGPTIFDSLQYRMQDWMDCRELIARDMQEPYSTWYRNQTDNIASKLLKP